MTELSSVDPRALRSNPNNPLRTTVPLAMEEQRLVSIRAIGILQPPRVTPKDDGWMIVVGNRRVKAAIRADLPLIDGPVCNTGEVTDTYRVMSARAASACFKNIFNAAAIETLSLASM